MESKGVPLEGFKNNTTSLADQMLNQHMGNIGDRKTFSKKYVIHLKDSLDLEISAMNQWLIYRCNVRTGLELVSKTISD